MIQIPFAAAALLYTAVWLLIRAAVCVRRRRVDWRREAVLLILYFNFLVVLRFTFFPFSRLDGRIQPLLLDTAQVLPFRINWIPFLHILEYDSKRDLLINLIGNAALFLPSGVVLPLVCRRLDSFRRTVGTGALISLFIELLQLPFAVRATDVDDLILNTAGCAVGYALYALVRCVGRLLHGVFPDADRGRSSRLV